MNKEGFKDTLYCRTKVKVSVLGRIKNLFCPEIEVEHIVHCKEIMPVHKAEFKIRSISYWDKFKWDYFQKKNHVMSAEAPMSKEEELKKKLNTLLKKK